MSTTLIIADVNVLIFELGVIIFFSVFVSFILKKFGIPAVLGLILSGLLLSILSNLQTIVFSSNLVVIKKIITDLALSWIGYDIGNEIDLDLLRNKLKDYGIVLFGQGIGALVIVFIGVYILTQNFVIAFILGAIGMATAPAATSQVLGEYNAKGELSQIILFILAFDDLLAIIFVEIGLGFSLNENSSGISLILFTFGTVTLDIIYALIFGVGGALIIIWMLHRKIIEDEKSVEWILGAALIIIGILLIVDGSLILTMFLFGIIIKTQAKDYPKFHNHIVETDTMMIPIVLLFFVLVGLTLDINLIIEGIINISVNNIGSSILIIGIIAFILRFIGKTGGTWLAGLKSTLPAKVKQNLPLCLVTQAGVSIGLAGLAYDKLSQIGLEHEAIFILNAVAISVIIAEILGPIMVKKAIFRSGEVNGGIQNSSSG